MNVVGRTNKTLVHHAAHAQDPRQSRDKNYLTKSGRSQQKKKPYQPNKSKYKSNNHGKKSKSKRYSYDRDERDVYLSELEFGSDSE